MAVRIIYRREWWSCQRCPVGRFLPNAQTVCTWCHQPRVNMSAKRAIVLVPQPPREGGTFKPCSMH